ncbi:MAG: urea ABC transporter ATP-binding subunit UrtE [Pseudomonadota bacterium]
MTNALTLTKLSSSYGQSQVLWDIDLDVPKQAALAVIGRNGVGKSTLINTIMGVHKASGGTLALDGTDITRLSAHHRARAGLGFVPQGRHIFPHLTVMENLESGLAAQPKNAPERGKIPGYIFDLFPKLATVKSRKGGVLSGGEQQQLAIGRALTGHPKVLLLDEPTEGIQPNVVQQIETALTTVRQELGLTIIIVEQYLDFVWRFADHFCAMDGGKIIEQGRTADYTAGDIAHLVRV